VTTSVYATILLIRATFFLVYLCDFCVFFSVVVPCGCHNQHNWLPAKINLQDDYYMPNGASLCSLTFYTDNLNSPNYVQLLCMLTLYAVILLWLINDDLMVWWHCESKCWHCVCRLVNLIMFWCLLLMPCVGFELRMLSMVCWSGHAMLQDEGWIGSSQL